MLPVLPKMQASEWDSISAMHWTKTMQTEMEVNAVLQLAPTVSEQQRIDLTWIEWFT